MYCGPQISQVSHVEGVRSACHSTGENVIHVHSMEEGTLPMEDRCFQSTRVGDERESLRCWGKEQRSGLFPELPKKPAL